MAPRAALKPWVLLLEGVGVAGACMRCTLTAWLLYALLRVTLLRVTKLAVLSLARILAIDPALNAR